MSGEYFTIEEVDPNTYFDDYDQENDSLPIIGNYANNAEIETKSNASKKSQDSRLHEIEEQLQQAENRCNTLKGQLDSMKQMYQKSSPSSLCRTSQISCDKRSVPLEQVFTRKISRKGSKAPKLVTSPRNRISLPMRKQNKTFGKFDGNMQQNSSGSSTTVHKRNVHIVHHKTMSPLVRQTPTVVITDYSEGPTKTINSILSGITASMHQHQSSSSAEEKTKFMPISEIPGQFSPRVERRAQEQQRRIEEIIRIKHKSNERIRMSTTSVKSKTNRLLWSSHVQSKTQTHKTKTQISSGSLNIAKPIKSTAKHVANTTKLRPVRNGMIDQDSVSVIMTHKRKRNIKRLHNSTKRFESLIKEDNGLPIYNSNTSTNLIELYHNTEVKASDSDESRQMSKTQVRQKGGGDLPLKLAEVVSFDEVSANTKPANPLVNSRILATINEHSYRSPDHYVNRGEYALMGMIKNYAQPTIASKLKKVAKSYLRRFNVKQIPFCVAKSTSPSHNIGVNIQQVMSIIKTRQPVFGISPTLAHNIGLAAGKLQSNPLSTLVSTLTSKMAYRHSHCPLSQCNVDYNELQEIAKIIEKEPYEQRPGFAGDGGSESVINKPPLIDSIEMSEIKEEKPSEPACWTIDPLVEKCTCGPQKGVPFDEVLTKFQMSTDHISIKCNESVKPKVSRTPYTKPTYPTAVERRATKTLVKATSTNQQIAPKTATATVRKSDGEDLSGKERTLKSVLKNLYDEFDTLNTKYDDLSKEAGTKASENSETTNKELENLETVLNKKEEEINMVMSLYTEVMALKTQVKKLRERTSQSGISVVKSSVHKEPAAAAHLTQLLRQIQNYQSHCKPSPRVYTS